MDEGDTRETHAAPAQAAAVVRLDALLGGCVRLHQPARGYRAGMDAALLAAALGLEAGERALEAGCGAGAGLLQAAARSPAATLVGFERDPAMLALAVRNVALNGFGNRVSVRPGAVADPAPREEREAFDVAFANPPFFDDPASLRAPSPERSGAWMAEDGLQAWLDRLTRALKRGGRAVAVHRADRLGDLLAGFAPAAGSLTVRPVQPFADAPAKRVLVRAVKGGRAPLALLAPLVVHVRPGGRHTDEAEAILRGEAALGWR